MLHTASRHTAHVQWQEQPGATWYNQSSRFLMADVEGFKVLQPQVRSSCSKEAWLACEPTPSSCQAGACCRTVLMHQAATTDLDVASLHWWGRYSCNQGHVEYTSLGLALHTKGSRALSHPNSSQSSCNSPAQAPASQRSQLPPRCPDGKPN